MPTFCSSLDFFRDSAWSEISASEREDHAIRKRDDGEFWYSFFFSFFVIAADKAEKSSHLTFSYFIHFSNPLRSILFQYSIACITAFVSLQINLHLYRSVDRISVEDFIDNFDELELCHLSPDLLAPDKDSERVWSSGVFSTFSKMTSFINENVTFIFVL